MISRQVSVSAVAMCMFICLPPNVTSFSLRTRNSLKGTSPYNVDASLIPSQGRDIFRLDGTIVSMSSSSSSSTTSMSTTTSTSTTTSITTQEKIKFEMLSSNPLLFSSQKSILSKEECQTLSSWCQSTIQKRGGNLNNNVLLEGIANQEEGALLLKRLQQILHSDLLGFDKDLEEMVIPRYISYDEDEYGADMNTSSSSYKYGKDIQNYKVEDILPDGLHVDTNNSKFSRHWTILFYLDTCDTLGATSFPLAELLLPRDSANADLHVDEERMHMQRLAASKLIFEEGIQHTKYVDATPDQLSIMKFVDEAGLDMIKRQNSDGIDKARVGRMGLRILPRHGHFCLFSGLSGDGYANPLSFHGAEAMYPGETKSVLTFFYEIPMGTFTSRAELGDRAREREEKFLKLHQIEEDDHYLVR